MDSSGPGGPGEREELGFIPPSLAEGKGWATITRLDDEVAVGSLFPFRQEDLDAHIHFKLAH